jgi:phosphoribosylformylglycinamidine synthase
MAEPYNPNGSDGAVCALTSPCGLILGMAAHPERAGAGLLKNVYGNMDLNIFKAGTEFFM